MRPSPSRRTHARRLPIRPAAGRNGPTSLQPRMATAGSMMLRCSARRQLTPVDWRLRVRANQPRLDSVRHVARCRVPHAVDTARLASRLPAHPVTRFAPAPTGYLHLGHVLNAEYVWGLARELDGRVILRIEDHDRGRARPSSKRRFSTISTGSDSQPTPVPGRLSIGGLRWPAERSR